LRITHRMLAQSISRNVRDNLYALEKKAVQLSSGRCFNRPSQDPAGTYKVMRITGTGLFRNEQYQRNIGEGITWLTVTEDALADAINIMQRLKELTVYAANGTLTPEDRSMILPEVEELFNHLVSIGNTEVGGLYIFGGYKTQEEPPYEIISNPGEALAVKYQGDEGQRIIEITPSQTLPINLTGREAFGEGETDLFQTVSKLAEALEKNNTGELGGEILQKVDARLDYLLQQRAEIGARMERLWSTEQRLQGEHIHLRELRSKIEDLDLAEAITEFTMQENAYKAALATGARMIYPSLIDFLR
jgi:flagellar hook-associated protein 3 FlgL